MAKIDWSQLDDFDFTSVQDGDILVYNSVTGNFEPEPQAVDKVIFRRTFLLMGA
jgi:hypothetical protein